MLGCWFGTVSFFLKHIKILFVPFSKSFLTEYLNRNGIYFFKLFFPFRFCTASMTSYEVNYNLNCNALHLYLCTAKAII